MKVPFGFSDIEPKDKTAAVRNLFGRVAGKYDLMNDVMSLGVHRCWKKLTVDALAPQPGEHILDLAGGTGDLASAIRTQTMGLAQVTVCDLTEAMLQSGRAKHKVPLHYVCAAAEALPFSDNAFHACTLAFGLRNMSNTAGALREVLRVLKPGGRLLCLEFSKPVNPLLRRAYDAYSFNVIPQLGKWLAGDEPAYRYLVESIRRFPDQDTLAALMRECGFSNVNYRNLSNGIAALHRGIKP